MNPTARRPAWATRRGSAAGAALSLLGLSLLGASPVTASPLSASSVTASSVTASPGTAPPGPGAASSSSTATASEEDSAEQVVRIVLDDVEPTVAVVGEPLVLRGRVVNDTGRGQRLARISAHAAWSALTEREAVDGWLADRDTRATPWHLGDGLLAPVVAAGSEVPFTITVPGDVLNGVPADQSVLAVELEVERGELPVDGGTGGSGDGSADPGEPGGEAGAELAATGPITLRTVLTATRGTDVSRPLALSWVVPLTLPADAALLSADEEVRLPAWHRVSGEGSAARTWLEHLTGPGITWLVDPALLVAPAPTSTLLGVEPAPAEGGTPAPASGTPTATSPAPTGSTGSTAAPSEAGDGPTDATTDGPTPDGPAGDSSGDPTDVAAGEAGDNGSGEPASQTGQPPTDDPAAADDPRSAADDRVDEAAVDADLVMLREAIAGQADERLWWLPTDDPDLAGLLALPQTTTTRSAISTVLSRTPDTSAQLEELTRRGRDDVAAPLLTAASTTDLTRLRAIWAARAADRAAAGTAAGTGTRDQGTDELAAVVLPRETVAASSAASVGQAAVTLSSPAGLTVLASDTRAGALISASAELSRTAGAAAAAQVLLADTLTGWSEAPDLERSMLVVPPRATMPDAAFLSELSDGLELAPWLRSQSAASLLTSGAPGQLSGGEVDPAAYGDLEAHVRTAPSPLDDSRARILATLRRDLTGIGQVLTEAVGVESWEPVLGSLWSTRWRSDRSTWDRTWRELRTDVAEVRSGVHINPSTINFLSDQGVMRVTVVNSLPVAVEGLRVELVPGSNILQVIDQPEPFSVGAGSRATVSFTARAVTRGSTAVTARLTAPNGTPFGDSAAVDVHVQPTGVWIYWVLGGVAGILLLLGVRRSLRSAPRVDTVGPVGTARPVDTARPSQETE